MVYLICNSVKSMHSDQCTRSKLSHYIGEKNQEEDGEEWEAKAQNLVLNNFFDNTSLTMQ